MNVHLRLRAGALFFITLSLAILSIIMTGWNDYANLVTIVVLTLAMTYLFGGTLALVRNERKGILSIFIANLLTFVLLLAFFLFALYGYFTDPCYLEPASCDDQLTDAPAELTAIGVWTGILALITYMSWRLQRGHITDETNIFDT